MMVKVLFNIFLIQVFVAAQLLPLRTYANQNLWLATDNIFTAENTRELLNSGRLPDLILKDSLYVTDANGNRAVNKYALAGVEHADDLKTRLNGDRLINRVDPNSLLNNSEYRNMVKTEQGRLELFRQFKQNFAAISVELNENIFNKYQNSYNQIKRQAVASFVEQGINESEILKSRDLRQKLSLEIHRRFYASFDTEIRTRSLRLIRGAQQFLLNSRLRAQFNVVHGITAAKIPSGLRMFNPRNLQAMLRGNNVLTAFDPVVGSVDIEVPRDPQGLKQVKAVKVVEALKSGTFQAGGLAAVMAFLMYGISIADISMNYSTNPMAVMNMKEEVYSAPFVAQLGSFFIGGGIVGSIGAIPESVTRKNIYNIYRNMKMVPSDPKAMTRSISASMAGLSRSFFGRMMEKGYTYKGLAGGLIISKIVREGVVHMRACKRLMTAKDGSFTNAERAQMEEECEKGWGEIAASIIAEPALLTEIFSMWSAKALLTFFMSKSQFLRYGVSNTAGAKNAVRALTRGAAKILPRFVMRGVATPLISFVIMTGPQTLLMVGTFVLVFTAVFWLFEKAFEQINIKNAKRDIAEEFVALMQKYRETGWNIDEVCQSSVMRVAQMKMTKRGMRRDGNRTNPKYKFETCEEELSDGFLEAFKTHQQQWRASMVEPINQAVTNWINYTYQATNLYKTSNLLYKDISDQIRLQKDSGRVPLFNRTEKGHTRLNEISGYQNAKDLDQPLPLFRSDPFFGWNFKLKSDKETYTGYEYPYAYNQRVKWEDRLEFEENEKLMKRYEFFKENVIPSFVRDIRANIEDLSSEDQEAVNEIVKHITNDDMNHVAYGLHLLSEKTQNEIAQNSRCMRLIYTAGEQNSSYNSECFYSQIQMSYVDPEVWTMHPEKEALEFVKNSTPFFGGYKDRNSSPFGVRPMSQGQRFFIFYHERIQRNGNDAFFFDSSYDSLTDYLLKSMLCGVNLANGETMIAHEGSIHRKPEYKAPRIPLKSDFNPCFQTMSTSLYGNNNRGWNSSFGIYHYIEDAISGSKSYGGIVDLLYNEASDEFVHNFDNWWKASVQPQFEQVLDRVYNKYFKEKIIDEDLFGIVSEGNTDTNCYEVCRDFEYEHKYGYGASIKQELDLYFNYVLSPLIKDMNIDLGYVPIPNEVEGRVLLMSQFGEVRSDLYAIFDILSFKRDGFETVKLQEDYQARYNESVGQVQESAIEYGVELDLNVIAGYLKLKTLKEMVEKRLFDLDIILKNTNADTVKAFFDVILEAAKSNPNLSEADIAEIEIEVNANRDLALAEYEARMHRNGRVLINYDHDWPEDVTKYSPTQLYTRSINASIMGLFDELFSLNQIQYRIQTTEQMTR